MSIKATFPEGVNEIVVHGLHQWDYGRNLEITIPDLNGSFEVHIACAGMREAVVRSCAAINGVMTAVIPDQCLEQTSPVVAWVYEVGATSGKTLATAKLIVTPRAKPASSPTVPTELGDKYTEAAAAMNEVLDTFMNGGIVRDQADLAEHAYTADGAPSTGKDQTAEDDGGKTFTFPNTHGFGSSVPGVSGHWKLWNHTDGTDADHTGDGKQYTWLIPSHSERMSIGHPTRLVKRVYAKLLGAADCLIKKAYVKTVVASQIQTTGAVFPYKSYEGKCLYIVPASGKFYYKSNDWLSVCVFKLEAGKTYSVTYNTLTSAQDAYAVADTLFEPPVGEVNPTTGVAYTIMKQSAEPNTTATDEITVTKDCYLYVQNRASSTQPDDAVRTSGIDVLTSLAGLEAFKREAESGFEDPVTVYEGGGPRPASSVTYNDGAFGLYQAEVLATGSAGIEVYSLGQFQVDRETAQTTILPFVPNGLQMYKIKIQHDGKSNNFTVSASYHPFCDEKPDQEYSVVQVRFRRIMKF